MSLIAATQITAVATLALAVFAFVTAIFAFLAFRKQSQEVGMLRAEATRQASDRRKAQAAKVFVALGGLTPDMADEVRAHNTSGQPIYDLVVAWADGAELQRVPHLMPGEEYPFFTAPPEGVESPVVWLDFRDAVGLRWRTTSQGHLTGPQDLEDSAGHAASRWWQKRRRATAGEPRQL
jgi:hypothetical protein